MKQLLVILFLVVTSSLFAQTIDSINPVIGDLSFVTRYGSQPSLTDNETDRIKTHLAYVEEQLRATDVSALTVEQQAKRTEILDHLHTYWQREQFPINTAYPNERKPCFIDEKGTICAVGYLIEQTAGLTTAEAINEQYQYATITEMMDKLPEIAQWATENGLTVNECAMIQPTYMAVRMIKNQIGIVGGYTQAFGKIESAIPGGSLQSNAGFELAMTDTYRFEKLKLSLQTSLGVNSRNLTVKAYDESFQLRNDRWFLSSLILIRPFKRGPSWLRRTIVKLGAQANFYSLSSVHTSYSSTNLVKNTIVKTGKPEMLLVAELSYGLKPLLHHGHAISISYSYGLTKTMHGSVSSNLNSETLRYSDAGSYLGIKYTFWFTRGYRTSMG
ncbi:MAG: hypothetical protein HYZ43_16795 [Flavobacteriia bacterium]|nr:hypothetical protein [Flavobacteriia bacterium]